MNMCFPTYFFDINLLSKEISWAEYEYRYTNINTLSLITVLVLPLFHCYDKLKDCWFAMYLQGVPKKLQSIENNLLLEFQWPRTN